MTSNFVDKDALVRHILLLEDELEDDRMTSPREVLEMLYVLLRQGDFDAKDPGQACFDRYTHAKLYHAKPLLCLDFDGVLHRYSKGYHDATAYDVPTEGALDFVQEASEHFQICISSARANTETGRQQIREWLRQYGFPDLPIEVAKPPAFLTIDDRVHKFDGTWPDPKDLLQYRAWNGEKWGSKA